MLLENPTTCNVIFAEEFGASATVILQVFKIKLPFTVWILAEKCTFSSDN